MADEKHVILGVHVTDRLQRAVDVQRILTANGGIIKTRLGLHDLGPDPPSPNGLLILELAGDDAACQKLADDLAAIEGIEVQQMVFGH